MSYFHEWGFLRNPFETTALPANEQGKMLLVGRQSELNLFKSRLRATSNVVTLEGANGVGKTSLANVGTYLCYDDHISTGTGSLFIPCNRYFQLTPKIDLETFVPGVLLEVAQTLVSRRQELAEQGRKTAGLDSLDRWLNSSRVGGWEATLGAMGVTFGFGKSQLVTASTGFDKVGFRAEIVSELTQIFPGDGGVVCIIDNLELLRTSAAARDLLEELRDDLMYVPGIRWVLAGARGIIDGVASSPRLDGFLSTPIRVGGIDDAHAAEILTSRIRAFSRSAGEAPYLPLTPRCFAHLYHLLAKIIRGALGRATQYCEWAASRPLPSTADDKERSYLEWLDARSQESLVAANRESLTPRAWEIFDTACASLDGCFTPSDFAVFGCNSARNLSRYLRDLEKAGLFASFKEESDKRRKTILVTPKGRMVHYARQDSASRLSIEDPRQSW